MVKSSDLLKLFLVISTVEICRAMAIAEEPSFDVVSERISVAKLRISRIIPQYDQDVSGGWVPVPSSYFSPPNYMPASYYPNRFYPAHHEKVKTWLVAPSKRNSELINSLLGLPKNMDAAGK
jgi:hypothetical protein